MRRAYNILGRVARRDGKNPALVQRSRKRLEYFRPRTTQAEINHLKVRLTFLSDRQMIWQCFGAIQRLEEANG